MAFYKYHLLWFLIIIFETTFPGATNDQIVDRLTLHLQLFLERRRGVLSGQLLGILQAQQESQKE